MSRHSIRTKWEGISLKAQQAVNYSFQTISNIKFESVESNWDLRVVATDLGRSDYAAITISDIPNTIFVNTGHKFRFDKENHLYFRQVMKHELGFVLLGLPDVSDSNDIMGRWWINTSTGQFQKVDYSPKQVQLFRLKYGDKPGPEYPRQTRLEIQSRNKLTDSLESLRAVILDLRNQTRTEHIKAQIITKQAHATSLVDKIAKLQLSITASIILYN